MLDILAMNMTRRMAALGDRMNCFPLFVVLADLLVEGKDYARVPILENYV